MVPPLEIESNHALGRWLRSWIGEAQEEQKELFFQGAYVLWLARSATRDGVRTQDAIEVAASVSRFMDEWSNAVPKKLRSSSVPPVDKCVRRSKGGPRRTWTERWAGARVMEVEGLSFATTQEPFMVPSLISFLK